MLYRHFFTEAAVLQEARVSNRFLISKIAFPFAFNYAKSEYGKQ